MVAPPTPPPPPAPPLRKVPKPPKPTPPPPPAPIEPSPEAIPEVKTEPVQTDDVAVADNTAVAPESGEPLADAAAQNPQTAASEPPAESLAEPTALPRQLPAPPVQVVTQLQFPAPVVLKYDVRGKQRGFPYGVNGELRWSHDASIYSARLSISHFLLGSRVQTSTGAITPQGLEPLRFGDKFRSEVAAHFQRDKGKVTFSANTPDVDITPGLQDQLSVFMQIAAMLAGEPEAYPTGTTLPFQAIGPRSAANWTFNVGAIEKLTLPGGEVNAIRLWREPTEQYEPMGEIWLAPAMGYLPVRIRLSKSEDEFSDMQWSETLKP
jgi:hypothetical protein